MIVAHQVKRLPSLTAIRYFEVSGRLQSFTAAAAELYVTQGAVSRMIQTLEEQLEARLFERNGRWISLTPAGHAYHEQITVGLNKIINASNLFKENISKQLLTLSVNTGFTLWLVNNINDLRTKHPDLQVNILPEEQKEPNHDFNVHACIRYGPPPWHDYEATCLLEGVEAGVVCSPRLEQLAKVREPADLLKGPLLSVAVQLNDPWVDYFHSYKLPMPDLGNSPRFLQLLTMREAAIAGLGFAVVPLFLFRQDIQDGRLVQALPHTCMTRHGYHFLLRKNENLNPQIKIFKKWLTGRLRMTVNASA